MLYLRILMYYYTFTHKHARTAHGHARACTDIGLCVPRTHGRATDMPRTFPVALEEPICTAALPVLLTL